jgi:hypothetical protein
MEHARFWACSIPEEAFPLAAMNGNRCICNVQLMKGEIDRSMPKPKARSRYIRRIHEREERARRMRERELWELAEALREVAEDTSQAVIVRLEDAPA